MENWIERVLLINQTNWQALTLTLKFKKLISALLLIISWLFPVHVFADAVMGDIAEQKPLIEPDVRPQVVDESVIDTENFELGGFVGVINIEDFESSILLGGRLAYHLSEHFFFEGIYGVAEGGETSFEKLGNVQLLSNSDRDYSYYSFGLGVNTPGQLFLPGNYTFNTNFYLVGGIGATEFGGDKRTTFNFGAGYQVLLNDWLAFHVTAREHIYEIDILGEEKNSFNAEFSSGLSFFF